MTYSSFVYHVFFLECKETGWCRVCGQLQGDKSYVSGFKKIQTHKFEYYSEICKHSLERYSL